MPPRITLISASSPAKPYHSKLHTPHDAPPTQHELHIELRGSYTDDKSTARLSDFLAKIRAAVAQGDVDAVVMYDEGMTDEVWKALDGAKPWHLEMVEGFCEMVSYDGLQDLATRWPLRSVYIGSYNGSGEWSEWDLEENEEVVQRYLEEGSGYDITSSHGELSVAEQGKELRRPSFPACYSTIETLVLDYPNYRTLYFYPEGGAQNLRSLTICENEAVKTFACTVMCNPTLVDTLETITVVRPPSTYNSYDSEGRVMKRFFRDSKALRNVELVLASGSIAEYDEDDVDSEADDPYARYSELCPYTGLHSCLPPTLEYLSLSCPADQLTFADLDHWIASARNPTWLPNLRTVAFSFEFKAERLLLLSWEEERELDEKVGRLMESFRERGVEVVDPRSDEEMHYPLPP